MFGSSDHSGGADSSDSNCQALPDTEAEADAISMAAANWLLRQEEIAAEPKLQKQFLRWRDADPRHAQALAQMQAIWQAGAGAPRRRGKKTAAVLMLGLLLLLAWPSLWLGWQADYQTGLGEVVELALPDGSVLALNSDSAVALAFSAEQRGVRLLRGEVFAKVAKDGAARPFTVFSDHGDVRALGTEFIVRQGASGGHLQVLESQVRLSSAAGSEYLSEGQEIAFSQTQLGQPAELAPGAGSWRHNKLLFIDRPLVQVVAEIGRYQRGWIRLAPSLEANSAQLRFTGSLPLDNPHKALATLARALDLEHRPYGPWFHRLAAKQ